MLTEKVGKFYTKYGYLADTLLDVVHRAACIAIVAVVVIQIHFLLRCILEFTLWALGIRRFYDYSDVENQSYNFFHYVFYQVVVMGLLYLLYYHLVVKKKREELKNNQSGNENKSTWKNRVELLSRKRQSEPYRLQQPQLQQQQSTIHDPVMSDGYF